MMDEETRSKHVELTKKCGIKIDYKNCASRWLLKHTHIYIYILLGTDKLIKLTTGFIIGRCTGV